VKKSSLVTMVIVILAFMLVASAAGCAPGVEPDPVDEPEVENEIEEPDLRDKEDDVEKPEPAANYFWPWISHGEIVLSSTEVIDGPHLFESDTGFVGEFTRDTEYSGRIVWLVEKTDVFEIEWLTLAFDVDYYALHEWQMELHFMFEIEDLELEPDDEGVQSFEAGLVDEQEGFRVEIKRVNLGKEQEGSFTTDPINYVALDVEITVIDKP